MQTEIERFKLKYALQRDLLLQSIHDVQSPLSATSGYLELMQIAFSGNPKIDKALRYRNSIDSGVDHIGKLVQQLENAFECNLYQDSLPDMQIQLQWMLTEVCSKAEQVFSLKKQKMVTGFSVGSENMHVTADICLLKLFLYNIVLTISRYSAKESVVQINCTRSGSNGVIQIVISRPERPASDLSDLLLRDKFSTRYKDSSDTESEASDISFKSKALLALKGTLSYSELDGGKASILLMLPLVN
ncbi:MAG: hypothetical protein LAT84_10125 [Balneolia bacterium]|nr:hypothetical protein [Balneolia bacterium]